MNEGTEIPAGLALSEFTTQGVVFTIGHQQAAWRYILITQGWSAFPAGLLEKALVETWSEIGPGQDDGSRIRRAAYRGADRMLQAARKGGVIEHDRSIRGWRWKMMPG